MKIYQIIFFTFSTVSFIHCSQQPDQNEDNNSAYHIEFEDKSANGGYGYKVQVAGKSKYQETWKNDKQNIQTESATESLNYLQNSYSGGTENIKTDDSNVADNYLSSSAAHSNSITPTVDAIQQSGQYIHQQPINDEASSYQNAQIIKNPYASYSQQIYKPDLLSQNSFSSQIQESSRQGWQIPTKSAFVPSVPPIPKQSLQIMDYNHYGASNGPQVFVESTSGKLNQNQFANQLDVKPQISLPDLSSHYLQNANKYQNYFEPKYVNTPISVGYYQPSTQKGTYSYKTTYTSQPISKQVPQLNTDKNNYQVNELYTSPVTQYANDAIASQNLPSSQLQYYSPSPKPTTYLSEQKIKHSKGNVVHKTKATTIKYAPQYQQESVEYSQNPVGENNVYKHYIPLSHPSQIPLSNLDYSQSAIQSHYIPSTVPSNYQNELSQVSASQLGNQEVKYVIDQNSQTQTQTVDYSKFLQQYPSQSIQLQSITTPVLQNTQQQSSGLQIKYSPQLSNDYSQFLKVPTDPTGPIKSLSKNTQYQNVYNVQQPTVNYHYKQQLSYPKIQSNSQNIPLNTINHGDQTNSYKIQSTGQNSAQSSQSVFVPLSSINNGGLSNSYNNVLGGYSQQATSSHGIPISPYVSSKDNSQLLYAPGMIYGQGANGQSLLNFNAFSSSLGNQGSLGGLDQVMSPYIMRRSSAKHNNKNVDQKQTE